MHNAMPSSSVSRPEAASVSSLELPRWFRRIGLNFSSQTADDSSVRVSPFATSPGPPPFYEGASAELGLTKKENQAAEFGLNFSPQTADNSTGQCAPQVSRLSPLNEGHRQNLL